MMATTSDGLKVLKNGLVRLLHVKNELEKTYPMSISGHSSPVANFGNFLQHLALHFVAEGN